MTHHEGLIARLAHHLGLGGLRDQVIGYAVGLLEKVIERFHPIVDIDLSGPLYEGENKTVVCDPADDPLHFGDGS